MPGSFDRYTPDVSSHIYVAGTIKKFGYFNLLPTGTDIMVVRGNLKASLASVEVSFDKLFAYCDNYKSSQPFVSGTDFTAHRKTLINGTNKIRAAQ